MMIAAILAMVAGAVSWVSYREDRLWWLMALRFSSLLLLIWLFFDPVIRWTRSYEDKPVWMVLIDESRSMDAYLADVRGIRERLSSIDTTSRSVRIRPFGGETTDLDAALRDGIQPAPAGIVLVSDGIQTSGRDPVSRAELAGIPIFAIPVGDPSPRRDIALLDARFPDRAPQQTSIDVPLRLIADGFESQPVTIRILADGTEVASHTWLPDSDQAYHAPILSVRTAGVGRTRYEVRVDAETGEASDRNNRIVAVVQITAERIRLAHVIHELHPDVGTFRQILSRESTIEVASHHFRMPQLDSTDVLLIHGWPTDPDFRSALTSAMLRIPHILAPLPATWTHPDLRSAYGGGSVTERLPVPNRSGSHPVTDLPPLDTERSPYLYGPATTLGDASVLMMAADGGPILRVRNGMPRKLTFDVWGWHRWGRSPSAAETEWTERLIQQAVLWVASTDEESGIQLEGLPDILPENVPVSFIARVRNGSGQPQSDADVTVRLADRTYRMTDRGNGLYEVSIPPLPIGEHVLRVDATMGGDRIGSAERRIESGADPLEYRNLRRNDNLLQALAVRSGGGVATVDEVVQRIDSSRSSVLQEPVSERVRRHPIWFVLLMGLLAAEWVWRRQLLKP
jgi:hypothetical protein